MTRNFPGRISQSVCQLGRRIPAIPSKSGCVALIAEIWFTSSGNRSEAILRRITPPVLARLLLCSRQFAHRTVKAGRFGSFVRRPDGALEVELADVEAALGVTFTPEQIEGALSSGRNREIA
jgi:hypothetical protein